MINILTGPVHSGKTTWLLRCVQALEKKGALFSGFLSLSSWEHDQVQGYDLLELPSRRVFPFLRRNSSPQWDKTGPFGFVPSTLAHALQIINEFRSGVVGIVDEVGPLELEEGGLWPALEAAEARLDLVMIWVIRAGILEAWLRKLTESPVRIIDVCKDRPLQKLLKIWRYEESL